MARTRGAHSVRRESSQHVEGESSQQGQRRRPTASARRRAREGDLGAPRVDIVDEYQHMDDDTVVVDEVENVGEEPHNVGEVEEEHEEEVVYPGGPYDTSLLTSYSDHVALLLWQGEDRGELRLISHGKKCNKLGVCHPNVEEYVVNSGLLPLCNISYEYADKGLISAFVERWHRETNSFHLPVGEMTVTLDDVSMLLHLPITGQFCPNVLLDNASAVAPLIELLGVDREKAIAELRQCRGPHVRLSWLRDLYEDYCETEQWEYAARAYLLHLIGCTIFADKSATYISVSYLLLLRNLATCGEYAWGVAALVHMYEQLGDASFAGTKQLAGYPTLLQSWIYEHFPGMGRKEVEGSYDETRPRVARFRTRRQICSVGDVRLQIDTLTYDGVIWSPYTTHRTTRPFEAISLFSGFIRLGDCFHRHLPERVLRQYGYVQPIPVSPTTIQDTDMGTIDDWWLHYDMHVLTQLTPASPPYACTVGYMEWFRRVSHPYIMADADGNRPTLTTRRRRDIPDDRPVPTRTESSGGVRGALRRVAAILQRMVDCREVSEGTIAWNSTQEALQITREAVEERAESSRGDRSVRGRH